MIRRIRDDKIFNNDYKYNTNSIHNKNRWKFFKT